MIPKEITMVATLPPNKGVSDTSLEQVKHLKKHTKIHFIDFKQMYPEFLYPGGTKIKGATQPAIDNVEINSCLTWYNPFTWIIAALSIKSEIVHMHWWTYVLFPPLFTISIISKIRGKKIICNVHNVIGHESGFIDRFLTKIFLKTCDKIICHSTQNKRKLVELYKISSSDVTFLPIGIPNYLIQKREKAESRKYLSLPENKFILLCFGNIRKYKGVDILLKSFAELQSKVEDIHLVIAGKPWIDFSPYQELIDSNNLSEKVTLQLDYVPNEDISAYFSAADLLVLPYTHFDAQSGPGRIALGYGLPMIVSDYGGLSDLVANLELGVIRQLSGESLETSLTKALLEVISSDKSYQALSQGLDKKLNDFNWEQIVEKTTELYSELD